MLVETKRTIVCHHNYQERVTNTWKTNNKINSLIPSSYTRCKCNCGKFGKLLRGEISIELQLYSSFPILVCRQNTILPFLLELNPSHNKNRRRWSGFSNAFKHLCRTLSRDLMLLMEFYLRYYSAFFFIALSTIAKSQIPC